MLPNKHKNQVTLYRKFITINKYGLIFENFGCKFLFYL